MHPGIDERSVAADLNSLLSDDPLIATPPAVAWKEGDCADTKYNYSRSSRACCFRRCLARFQAGRGGPPLHAGTVAARFGLSRRSHFADRTCRNLLSAFVSLLIRFFDFDQSRPEYGQIVLKKDYDFWGDRPCRHRFTNVRRLGTGCKAGFGTITAGTIPRHTSR
jgi:hypothetical protein